LARIQSAKQSQIKASEVAWSSHPRTPSLRSSPPNIAPQVPRST
jgi:hypothetical protein